MINNESSSVSDDKSHDQITKSIVAPTIALSIVVGIAIFSFFVLLSNLMLNTRAPISDGGNKINANSGGSASISLSDFSCLNKPATSEALQAISGFDSDATSIKVGESDILSQPKTIDDANSKIIVYDPIRLYLQEKSNTYTLGSESTTNERQIPKLETEPFTQSDSESHSSRMQLLNEKKRLASPLFEKMDVEKEITVTHLRRFATKHNIKLSENLHLFELNFLADFNRYSNISLDEMTVFDTLIQNFEDNYNYYETLNNDIQNFNLSIESFKNRYNL